MYTIWATKFLKNIEVPKHKAVTFWQSKQKKIVWKNSECDFIFELQTSGNCR